MKPHIDSAILPFAIFAEFATENKKMRNGINRRVFKTEETVYGTDIHLEADGSIRLQPGTYRISGFSIVTMQDTMVPHFPLHGTNYPGYCLLYRREDEERR